MRQRFLTITTKGEYTLARSLPAWREAHARFVATVGSEHWIDLRNELEQLAHVVMDFEKPEKETPVLETIGS